MDLQGLRTEERGGLETKRGSIIDNFVLILFLTLPFNVFALFGLGKPFLLLFKII